MTFDFVESGHGPALLFLPGSYSHHAAWRAVQKALAGRYRVISTSLPGYGGTDEIRDESSTDMALMADFVARVVARAAEPVHLIGHSYGGLAAFASVLGGQVTPLSLITFEGNPIYSRPPDRAFPWRAAVDEMQAVFDAAVAADDPEAAGVIIDFWSRQGNFRSMPETFRQYCRSTVHRNVLDWQTARGFSPLLADYAAIEVPTTLVHGETANVAIIDISQGIASAVPQSVLKVVPGADHFLISTHPVECAAIIDSHMSALDAGRG